MSIGLFNIYKKISWRIRLLLDNIKDDPLVKIEDASVKSIKYFSDHEKAIFFGYHDKTPFSQSGKLLLGTSVKANDKKAESECSTMDVGYFNLSHNKPKLNIVDQTTTWCWQQGCMLQWNPNFPESEIYFNKLVDGKYGSVLLDISKNKILREYKYPIYSISPIGNFAVTLNFSRLGRLRPGYGYNLLPDNTNGIPVPKGEGLSLLDLANGSIACLISIEQLLEGNEINTLYEYYINHATFSPDGKKVSFFLIWQKPDNTRSMRFYFVDIKSKKVSLIESNLLISHYAWKDNNTLLATAMKNYSYWEYYEYSLSDKNRIKKRFGLKNDGHPMFFMNKNDFVTDTYPDREGNQHVLVANLETKKIQRLGKFYLPTEYKGQTRCDLHPRIDLQGINICIDVVVDNRRSMAVLNI